MPRIRLLQRIALVVLVALVAGITALYFLGRAAQVAPRAEESGSTLEQGGDAQVGEGFDHTVSQEGRPLFRIRGLRDRRDREGNFHVEEVLVTVFRADGSRYEMAADRGTYRLELRQARLEGAVRLEGPGGFVLEGEAMELLDEGTRIESVGPVTFRYGGSSAFEGQAGGFFATPEDGLYLFREGVTLASHQAVETSFDLAAQRLAFQREERLIRAEGEVHMRWGESELTARRVAAHLDPQRNVVELIQARWEVWALLPLPEREEAPGRRLSASGHSLSLALDTETRQARKLEIQGQGRQQAQLRLVEEERRLDLDADLLEADFAEGALAHAMAGGDVRLLEREGPEREIVRRAGGREARAWLDADGRMQRLEVRGDAVLRDGDDRIFADRFDSAGGRVEATGTPVVLLSERGELEAPRITFHQETRLAHATGGVEAVMHRGAGNPLEATPLAEAGEGAEPVRVVAREAFWRESPRSFLFRGQVRAWSGDRLVLADELRGDLEDEHLSAAGNVDTLFFAPASEERDERQIRVTAGLLSYAASDRLLVYRQDVVALEGGHRLSCQELTVAVGEDGDAESLLCKGEVRLRAPDGRSVQAERAEYDLSLDQVVFFGTPVVLSDLQGGEVTGRRVTYSTSTGKVTVAGEEALRRAETP
jgi:lipopolysaccharide transport protein LptA